MLVLSCFKYLDVSRFLTPLAVPEWVLETAESLLIGAGALPQRIQSLESEKETLTSEVAELQQPQGSEASWESS